MNKISCLIVTGPSGVGKTTLVDKLLSRYGNSLVRVITCTTRPPRENEVDGVHYKFLTTDEFKERKENNEFLETENVYGHWYGVFYEDIKRCQKTKKLPILTLSCLGAQKFYNKEGYLVIFIAPKSYNILEQRLCKRGADNREQLDKKLKKCSEELEYQNQFNHKIINDEIEKAVSEFKIILTQKDLGLDLEELC